jgi:hypothetical protein
MMGISRGARGQGNFFGIPLGDVVENAFCGNVMGRDKREENFFPETIRTRKIVRKN